MKESGLLIALALGGGLLFMATRNKATHSAGGASDAQLQAQAMQTAAAIKQAEADKAKYEAEAAKAAQKTASQYSFLETLGLTMAKGAADFFSSGQFTKAIGL